MKHNNKNLNQLENIEEIIELEKRDRIGLSISDRIASAITAFSGSMLYVGLHIIWFGIWMLINLHLIGIRPFDPFPFNFLTMIVSLEAIFLSSFVLISQNKQALQADKRAKIDLQVNMITERETTKLMKMILEIQEHLGMDTTSDEELTKFIKKTSITKLADKLDEAEIAFAKGERIQPQSAADTSK